MLWSDGLAGKSAANLVVRLGHHVLTKLNRAFSGRPFTGAARRVVAGNGRAHHLEAARRRWARSSGIDGQQATRDALKSPLSRPFAPTRLLALLCSLRSPSPSQPPRRARPHSPPPQPPIGRTHSSAAPYSTVPTLLRPQPRHW